MKKIAFWIIGVILVSFLVVIGAGIYKFNFTNDDIYVETSTGKVMQYDEVIKNTIFTSFYPLYFLTK